MAIFVVGHHARHIYVCIYCWMACCDSTLHCVACRATSEHGCWLGFAIRRCTISFPMRLCVCVFFCLHLRQLAAGRRHGNYCFERVRFSTFRINDCWYCVYVRLADDLCGHHRLQYIFIAYVYNIYIFLFLLLFHLFSNTLAYIVIYFRRKQDYWIHNFYFDRWKNLSEFQTRNTAMRDRFPKYIKLVFLSNMHFNDFIFVVGCKKQRLLTSNTHYIC